MNLPFCSFRFFLRPLLFLGAALSFSSCQAEAESESPIVMKKNADFTTVISIEPFEEDRLIPAALFGTNVEWFQSGNAILHPSGELRPELIAAGRAQNLSLIRFPGGTFSDYYHWQDGIGPPAQRPIRPHYTDEGSSKNLFGTPEVARFSQAVGAELLLTVNAGTGTAEQAAEWVRYCNAPVHPLRAQDGFPSPLGVKYWEVGNELYLPGNPGKINVSVRPEVYTARYLEYAKKMRAIDPTITLLAISSSNATRYPVPNPQWLEVLLTGASQEIDLIALHNSYFPLLFLEKNPSLKAVYQALWAAPEAVQANLNALSASLLNYPKGEEIGFAITEWGGLFSFEPEWIDHIKTLGTAVYVARLMQVYLAHPKVQLANYFKFTDPTFMSWVNTQGRAKVPGLVFELLSRQRNTRLITSSVHNSQTYDSLAVGAVPAQPDIAEITTLASRKSDTLFINVINRSWDTIHALQLVSSQVDLQRYEAQAHVITSDGVTDHNGVDMPPEVMAAIIDPPRSARAAAHGVELQTVTVDLSQPLSIQPFSVMTLELTPQ